VKKRILNVGCGKDNYGTCFIDKHPTRAGVIKCDLDVDKIPFPDGYFDIVYAKNVFEYLLNLGFAMREMYRVLKKGGKLILITDNANYWKWSLSPSHLGGGRDANNHFELLHHLI
jgi:SAM-dependent methyltransferase